MAATYSEVVSMVLDELRIVSGDSSITEEHVIFLANLYRLFLLELKKEKQGTAFISSSNEQTICLDLEKTVGIDGLDYCNDLYLRSLQEVPLLFDEEGAKVSIGSQFNIRTAFVSNERFKYVGNNKYLKNILYCTLGTDNKVYLYSKNPQFKYLEGNKIKLTGVFEDALKATELSCDFSNENSCDILEAEFPLDSTLLPLMIQLIVKELSGVAYKPKDTYNNAMDDLSDIANFVRRNMKSDIAKQMTQ